MPLRGPENATPESIRRNAELVLDLMNETARLKKALAEIARFHDPNYRPNSEYDKGLGAAYAALASLANRALKGDDE